MKDKYTVITGASRGLGKALAYENAKRNRNLILIALPNENINILSEELSYEFAIKTVCFEADLTNTDQIENVIKQITENYEVDMLINNAGTGGTKQFQNATQNYIDTIILLNIRALVMLTHSLLPVLKRQDKAFILNIASLASFGPMPYKTVYPASKAFVYSFTRGLYAELKNTNIFVSVAHPGGMATSPEIAERINKYNRIVKSTILSPEKTAQICMRQVLKNDSLIIPGFMNKVSWIIIKIVPVWLRLNIFKKTIVKELPTKNEFNYA